MFNKNDLYFFTNLITHNVFLNSRTNRLFLWIFIAAICLNCAKIGQPTGGPKDIAPPEITESTPKNFSTEFKEKKIILSFNEFVQINSLAQQFHVSPPMKEKPEFKLKGKTVIVELNDTLRENTTYSLNFGNGIADLNEGNALSNFIYVFSTGKTIDSLMVSGKITDALTNAPAEEIQVMLYENISDSAPIKEIPLYTSKTDKSGSFTLRNLKEGTYQIFALKDANSNLKFDLANEKIAFLDTLIIPGVSKTEITDTIKRKDQPDSLVFNTKVSYSPSGLSMYLFEEDHKKYYLSNSERTEKYKLSVVFSRTQSSLPEITPLDFTPSKNWFFTEQSKNLDTIIYWITDTASLQSNELQLKINYLRSDSSGMLKPTSDTIKFIYKEKKDSKATEKLFCKAKNITNNQLDYNQDIALHLSAPLGKADSSKIDFFQIKDSVGTNTMYQLLKDSLKYITSESNRRFYKLKAKWEENEQYYLRLLPGAFTDIYGRTNDTTTFLFSIQKKDYYGTVLMKMKNITEPVILQLLDSKDNILSEKYLTRDEDVKYEYLKPLKYKLKLVFDSNNNKKWDTGKYLEKRQPEKVKYFSGEMNVRSNWDMELDWDILK